MTLNDSGSQSSITLFAHPATYFSNSLSQHNSGFEAKVLINCQIQKLSPTQKSGAYCYLLLEAQSLNPNELKPVT